MHARVHLHINDDHTLVTFFNHLVQILHGIKCYEKLCSVDFLRHISFDPYSYSEKKSKYPKEELQYSRLEFLFLRLEPWIMGSIRGSVEQVEREAERLS
jgi:hypothetical protein